MNHGDRARGSSTTAAWLRRVADNLGMELDENDNASIQAVLREIDRRLAQYEALTFLDAR